MDLLGMFNELSHGLADLPMFPYFETAHYIVSVMALREQPGKEKVRLVGFRFWKRQLCSGEVWRIVRAVKLLNAAPLNAT